MADCLINDVFGSCKFQDFLKYLYRFFILAYAEVSISHVTPCIIEFFINCNSILISIYRFFIQLDTLVGCSKIEPRKLAKRIFLYYLLVQPDTFLIATCKISPETYFVKC